MRWPWAKPENRELNYTDVLLDHALAVATGDVVSGLAAGLEVAAGWWQRAFMAATVEGSDVLEDLITPHLGTIGRAMVTTGEIAFAIDTEGDMLTLIPATSVDVAGGPNPASWTYDLTLPGPTNTVSRTLPADRVLHLMYTPSRVSPWQGISPIEASGTTKNLLANIEKRLAEEFGATHGNGQLIAVPNLEASGKLQADLRALKGKLALVQSTATNWGDGSTSAPVSDFKPQRIGAMPPEATVKLRREVEQSILAAAGVPVSALGGSSDSGAREGIRQFTYATISPVAQALALTIGERFGVPGLRFNLEGLRAADMTGRSRTFVALTQGGMTVQDAARIAMLVDA